MIPPVARRHHHAHGDIPAEWWLVAAWLLTAVLLVALVRAARRVLVLRAQARRWPVVDAVVSEVPSRDGSPLLRYRAPDGGVRTAPAAERERGLADPPPGSVVRVHVDPRDPQRVVPTASAADLGPADLLLPAAGVVVCGLADAGLLWFVSR